MNRKSCYLLPITTVIAGSLLATSVYAASAASAAPHAGKGAPAPVATGHHPSSPKMPKLPGRTLLPMSVLDDYQQVTSALLTDPANTQVGGSVLCPTGKVVAGGGAVISSSSLSENLNASVPITDGSGWRVFVNNASTTSGTFKVYAICTRKTAKYNVTVGAGVVNGPGLQNTATVSCAKGTFPFGGGGFASSGSTAVNLNTSIPTAKGWRTDVNNASGSTNTATAYVVCGKKPGGYSQVVGTPTALAANTQGSSTATCPAGTLVAGGGGYSNNGSTTVDLNSSFPLGTTSWRVYQNSAGAGSAVTAYAVCTTAQS